ncbi:MAG: polyamine ABC transporter ATP-binding protein [Actinobacteria bacterium]|nr:polyamine ABC transporter ATP-binding protein [Actinomycetota bacterium]
MSDVRLEGVTKTFKETVAVDDISLLVEEGEFFSLLGPSGCGKTTTLRMIGGFEAPTSGRITLGDRDVTTLPAYKRNVNTVFQSYALFPHLDVTENVAYGLKRKKVAKKDIDSRVQDMLTLVDLEGYGRRRIDQLSGGQQQRVALARALVNRPGVLLLDEPLGALDLKLRKQMQLELKRIQSEVGITFIYVTHDQEEAMTMSDRIAVMSDGRFEQIGAPHDVYEGPQTEFVASFLGASNLLEGEIEGVEGDRAKVRLAVGTTISLPAERLPRREGAVRIGVRPEKLHIRTPDSSDREEPNAVDATVDISTYTGVSTAYECITGDGRKIVVYVQNLGRPEAAMAPGTRVRLSWLPEHTFAVEKGKRPDVEQGGQGA